MPAQSLRLLIVEDNADDAALLIRTLKQSDYDLTWERVDSSAGLQAALARQAWDIVISDYSMPQFNGLTALQIVKDHDDNLPFLLVSGTVGEDVAVGAMRAGANDYVMKDKPSRLLPAITRELHEAAEHRKQKAAQKALAESEERFRSFMRHFPGLAYVKDAAGRILFANEGFAKYLGMDPAMLPGKTNRDLFPPEFAEKITRDDQQILATGQSVNIEERFADRIWATYKFPIGQDAAGQLLAGFTLDITTHKQAEETIRRAARRWQNTFDAVHDAILILDVDQKILQCNRATEALLAKTAPNMVGRPCWEVVHGRTSPPPECPVTKLRQSLRHESVELAFDSKCWNVGVDPIFDEHGTLTGVVHTIRDSTGYKHLQAQLAQAQKMESIGQLAGGVAHDFNNLLQAIMGYTELLLSQMPASDKRYADLFEIQKTGQRAAALTRQLLAFARKQTIAPKMLDLNEAIEGILKMLRRLIGEHIDLTWTPGTQLWPVWMDPAQIDQLLANLLVNSRDAISGQGRITIATANQPLDAAACTQFAEAVPGDYVLLGVSDTGCGMTKEVLARIFEPFFTTKGVGQGTGLGLATVYGIVKQNHGFITVQSHPDKGTAFHIFLPRHAGATDAAQAQAQAVELPRSKGETVLLVEDELTILSLSRRLLERLGYTVLVANSPLAALRLAGKHDDKIHLVVTDVVMPEMSGRELAQRLLAERPKLKTLFMSGYTADIIARQGVLEEGLNFIQKPFTSEALATKVRQVLDGE
jgi:PAS domain S-box-containing protein